MSFFSLRPLLALCAVAAVLAFTLSDADARAARGSFAAARPRSVLLAALDHADRTERAADRAQHDAPVSRRQLRARRPRRQ